jgi:hypothetical protein
MQVYCTTCKEPWNTYHLLEDSGFEIGLSLEEVEVWQSLSCAEKLNEHYRHAFRTVGWEFGASLLNVIHCPCCPPGVQPDPNRLATKHTLELFFFDDQERLASIFEEQRL